MNTINDFSNSQCRLGALADLESLREPIKYPSLDRLRLVTFMPEPYALPQHVRNKMNEFSTLSRGTDVLSQYSTIPTQAKEITKQLFRISNLLKFISNRENIKAIRMQQYELMNPEIQMAIKMHGAAIDNIRRGKTAPYFAAYFDALPKPGPEPKPEPKAQCLSITDRLARRISRHPQSKKASKETMRLFKQQNKSKISLAEYHAGIANAHNTEKLGLFARVKKMAGTSFKKVLSKAAFFI